MADYDWRYENSITRNKEYLPVNEDEKYIPGRTNKVLSNYVDTIIHANMMNINFSLDEKMQYDYLFNSITARKRFFKRTKVNNFSDISLICEYYKYNRKVAEQALKVLSQEQINIIKEKLEKGG
jgi:aspartokinase